MGFWEHFPYTNFHQMNLDKLCEWVRKALDRSETAENNSANALNKVDNFIANLDVDNAVSEKIDSLVASGELAQLVDNKKSFKNAHVIFIGDSYGPYSKWPEKTGQRLGCTWYDQTISGASFLSGYQTGLDNFMSTHGDKADTITDIIVGGGINDSDATHLQSLQTDIVSFIAKAKSLFKNATIRLCYFGYSRSDSPIISERSWPFRQTALDIYTTAPSFGAVYMAGAENTIHNLELLNADLLHPNSIGGDRIADAITNILTVGGNVTAYSYRDCTLSAEHTGYLQEAIIGDIAVLRTSNLSFSNLKLSFAGGAPVELSGCISPYIDRFDNIPVALSYRDADLKAFNEVFHVSLESGKLYLQNLNIEDSGYFKSGTISTINRMEFSTTLDAFSH